MSISVDSTFGLVGAGCVTHIDGRTAVCSGGRRKFMTWLHTPVAAPDAIVVMLGWQAGTSDLEKDAQITYGDKHLVERVITARNNTGLRDGAVSIYVLESEQGIPEGPQRIRVNFTSDSGPRLAVSVGLVCADGSWIEVGDSASHLGPTTTPAATLSPESDAMIFGALYYGKSSPNLANATLDAGFTIIGEAIFTNSVESGLAVFARSDGTVPAGDTDLGWTLSAAGDSVGIAAVALIEVTAGTELAGRIPFVAAKTQQTGFGDITLPAEAGVGHNCVVIARNTDTATIPTVTAGWATFASGVDGQGRGWVIATKVVADTDFSGIGAWTNAGAVAMVVYDGAAPNLQTFTGNHAVSDGNATSWTYPALTRSVTARRGWVLSVALYGPGSTTSFEKVRKDRRTNFVGVSSELAQDHSVIAHTPLPADSVALANSGMTGPSGRWTSFSIEIFSTYEIIGEEDPWTWALTDGELPRGLVLDPATGAVTGTPTFPGTYRFRYSAYTNFQTLPEKSCSVVIEPEKKRRKTRDLLVLGSDIGTIILPDAIEDFTSDLSAEEGVVCAVRGKAYAPAGTDGECVFRRLLVSGYHRGPLACWVVPVIDGKMLHDLRTWVHRPAPASGTEERFHALVPLTREHPDYPGMLYGLRGAVAEVYIETTDPENRIHLEAAGWTHEPLNLSRIRQVGEADGS